MPEIDLSRCKFQSSFPKVIVMRILLIGLGLLIGLIFLEVGLRLIPRAQVDSIIERSSQRLELYQLDKRIGWTLRPNAHSMHVTRDDEAIQVETNSLGLRDREHTYKKPRNRYRILVLGDSFAEAKDVHLEEAFPSLVEQCLNRRLDVPIEVINAGVSGYGPIEEYLFYIEEGLKYQPDLVLLTLYVGNDLAELDRTTKHSMIAGFGGYRFNLNGGHLHREWLSWERPYDKEEISYLELFLRNYSRLYQIFAHPESKIYWLYKDWVEKFHKWYGSSEENQPPTISIPWYLYIHTGSFPSSPNVPQKLKDMWLLFQAITEQLHREVKANGSQLAVVIIPTEYQAHAHFRHQTLTAFSDLYEDEADAQWFIEEPNLTITKYLESQAIPALDLLPFFLAHDEKGGGLLYFDGDFPQHLNREGQKLTGDMICDWLIQNKVVRLPRPQSGD